MSDDSLLHRFSRRALKIWLRRLQLCLWLFRLRVKILSSSENLSKLPACIVRVYRSSFYLILLHVGKVGAVSAVGRPPGKACARQTIGAETVGVRRGFEALKVMDARMVKHREVVSEPNGVEDTHDLRVLVRDILSFDLDLFGQEHEGSRSYSRSTMMGTGVNDFL